MWRPCGKGAVYHYGLKAGQGLQREDGAEMKKLSKAIYCGYCYLYANWLFLIRRYDPVYKKSKWFRNGKYCFTSLGWQWTVTDHKQCRRANVNKTARYPVSPGCLIGGDPSNIHFSPDELNNFQGQGCYYQTFGEITIGKGVYIACNVGIITANHNVRNLDEHETARDVVIGDDCWIGMNSMIMPGVVLGSRTIVGAGTVVTHSFPEGNCVICGNPGRKMKDLA